MKNTQISYTVKPEKVAEHLSLVKVVFRSLPHSGIRDMKYACYQTAEHTFLHIAQFSDEAARKAFTDLPSFRAFRENLVARVIDKPVSKDIVEEGFYSSFV